MTRRAGAIWPIRQHGDVPVIVCVGETPVPIIPDQYRSAHQTRSRHMPSLKTGRSSRLVQTRRWMLVSASRRPALTSAANGRRNVPCCFPFLNQIISAYAALVCTQSHVALQLKPRIAGRAWPRGRPGIALGAHPLLSTRAQCGELRGQSS